MYASRRLLPLREAVAGALRPGPSRVGPEADDTELELAALWARPELHARLVERVGQHASARRAGTIVVLDAAALPLASPLSIRLGLPLVAARGRTRRPGGASPAERPYLVAGFLQPPRGRGPGRALPAGAGSPVGGCGVVRVGDPESGYDVGNFLSFMEIRES